MNIIPRPSVLYLTLAAFLSSAFLSTSTASADSVRPQTISQKIVAKVLSADHWKGGKVIPYDCPGDENLCQRFCDYSSTCAVTIISFPAKEYILTAYQSAALAIISENGESVPLEYLTIYECTFKNIQKAEKRKKEAAKGKARRRPCIDYADYEAFADDDLDDQVDDLRVKQKGREYFYDFSRDFMKNMYVVEPGRRGASLDLGEYDTAVKQKKIQRKYEKILRQVAKCYGINE